MFDETRPAPGGPPSRGLSRRQLLRRSLIVAGAGLVAVACGPASTPGGPAATSGGPAATEPKPGAQPTAAPPVIQPTTAAAKPTTAPAAAANAPVRGGVLTWAQWDKNDALEPAAASGASALEVIGAALDTVVAIDSDQQVYPALATKWAIEDNARRYTFTIRDDIKFHDGTPLDAAAVKRSWDRILDPAMKAAGTAVLLGPVEGIDAPDPRTVVVRLTEPYPLLLLQLWRPYFGILSPKMLDTLQPGEPLKVLVGSGPFKWGGRSADGVVTLDANPDYAWGPENLQNRKAPYLQSIKFRTVVEPGTRVATLESGESLLIDEVAEPDYARLKADKRFQFLEAPRRGLGVGFFVNVHQPPTDELAVRQALNWAVDRKGIVDKLFFGVHKVVSGPLSEGIWGRVDELDKLLGYDPARAQQILEAAGWKQGAGGIRERDGQKLALNLVSFRSPWHEMADPVQAQLRAVGIDAQVQKMERGAYLDFVRAFKHNLCSSAGTDIDLDQLRLRYHSSNRPAANFSNLDDPQLDALLERGSQQAVGSAERLQTYDQVQRRLMDLLPFLSVMSQVRVQGMHTKVHGLKMGPDGLNAFALTDVWIDG
jgi:peptide/nickel transport system substrate-binding protein